MATEPLRADSVHVTPAPDSAGDERSVDPANLEKPLREIETRAAKVELAVVKTFSLLHAIRQGGLLDFMPSDEEEAADHNSAVYLLDIAMDELERADEISSPRDAIGIVAYDISVAHSLWQEADHG